MKTVQGIYRQYQLVEKTKRKDLDGVVYLVAGERNLWVKLLKDKSSTKREQINSLICQGQSTGFERPLEIVTNEKGAFAGYTFHGPDMEIIPEKSKESYTEQKHLPQFHTSQKNISHSNILQEQMPGSKIQQKQVFSSAGMSGAHQWIILGGIGAILFAALALFLDKCFLDLIYTNVSTVAATGCATLSFGGILPGIVGIAGLLLYQKSFGRNINSVPVYCIAAIMAFVIFAALTYGIVGVLCVLITGIFGVVQAYQGVILSAIVLAIVGRAVFSSWKK